MEAEERFDKGGAAFDEEMATWRQGLEGAAGSLNAWTPEAWDSIQK
jgi:hypothetical protein